MLTLTLNTCADTTTVHLDTRVYTHVTFHICRDISVDTCVHTGTSIQCHTCKVTPVWKFHQNNPIYTFVHNYMFIYRVNINTHLSYSTSWVLVTTSRVQQTIHLLKRSSGYRCISSCVHCKRKFNGGVYLIKLRCEKPIKSQ